MLNEKQKQALFKVIDGASIFITGSGGVGKSYLIQQIRQECYNRYISVTSLTGCSSVLIGGVTLHRWTGITPENFGKPASEILNSMSFTAKKNWKNADMLIIDEVSMLSKEMFDKMDKIAKILRKTHSRSFGGIQLVVCGDFFQLPPIVGEDLCDEDKFVFCSKVWQKMFKHNTIELTEVVRQKDMEFVTILNKIRKGIIDEKVTNLLESRVNVHYNSNIIPTQLFSMKHEVERINKSYLMNLEGDVVPYKWCEYVVDGKTLTKQKQNYYIKQWENHCSCEKILLLSVGAQVVLLHNKFQEEYNLINGSRGVVIDFEQDDPIVEFKSVTLRIPKHTWEFKAQDSCFKYNIEQYPLKLAWALTIHKSQGMSLDCVVIDISTVFEEGQAYVALSRAKSLEGLYILNFNPDKIKANKTVMEYFK